MQWNIKVILFFLSLTGSVFAFSDAEIERNNTPETANTLASGVTMSGNLYDATDEDYFRIKVGSSGTLSIDISSYNRADVQVLNPSLQVVSGLDYLYGQESLSVGVASAGYYYIRIFDGPTWNSNTDPYELTVTYNASAISAEVEPNNSSSSANAPLFFKSLGEVSCFEDGQLRKFFNKLGDIGHDVSLQI